MIENLILRKKGESLIVEMPAKTKIVEMPDGSKTLEMPVQTKIVELPAKTKIVEMPSGNIILEIPDEGKKILKMLDGKTCTLTFLEHRKNETDFQIMVENQGLKIVKPIYVQKKGSIKLSLKKVFDRVFSTFKTLNSKIFKTGG